MTPEEMRRLSQLYGQQPSMGMAGSVPPAPTQPMPAIQPMPMQQPQPQMGMAGAQGPQGIGMAQQPVVPPAPQPQPQGVGIANNLGAGQPGMQQVMQDPTVGRMGTEEAVKINGGEKSADWKGMAKDLAKGLKSSGFGTGGIMSQKEIKNIGLLQEAKAPVAIGTAANQNAQQPGMSAAMQAITGSIGSQPGMLEMLKRMRR
jgi:hypothetical protein